MKNSMTFENLSNAMDLLHYLVKYNKDNPDDGHYNEIHVYQEDSLIIVEWDQVPYDHEYGGTFEYVDEDHMVMEEVRLPDHTYVYSASKRETDDIWDEWKAAHPDWKKDEWGIWREPQKGDE